MQADRPGNIGRAGFEFVRWLFVSRLLEIDVQDHFASALKWSHFFEALHTAIQHADAGRTAHFVTREYQEIAADFLNIQRTVPGALCRIHQRENSHLAGALAELGYGINGAEGVRNMRHRE